MAGYIKKALPLFCNLWHINEIRSSFTESVPYSVQAITLKAGGIVVNKVNRHPCPHRVEF